MSEQTAEPLLHRLVDPPVGRIESAVAWIADHTSPILIKEIRQALKGRSFLLAYMLLLLAALVWSFWGLAITLTTGMQTGGGIMLVGYLWIVGFPLGIVVPLTAYRSICREFEEDTLHLVSITTMSPRQLVMGKLVSAMAQMVIYLSAMAPCIAFTWMLRGVDVVNITLALLLAVVGSASLASTALFLGSISRNPVFRIVVMVAMIVGLTFAYSMWCAFRVAIESGEMGSLDISFQIHVSIMLVMGTTGLLMLEAAAASISFPADNRSTRPRIAMVLQTVILAAMIFGMLWHNTGSSDFPGSTSGIASQFAMGTAFAISMYWMVMGCVFCGEGSVLSARVRRTLPKTILGRSFFSLLMPGAGRGYLLAVMWIVGSSVAALVFGLFWFDDPQMLFASFTGYTNPAGASMMELDMAVPLVGTMYALFYLAIVFLTLKGLKLAGVMISPVVGLVLMLLLFPLINLGSWVAHALVANTTMAWDMEDFSFCLLPNIFLAFDLIDRSQMKLYAPMFWGFWGVIAIVTAALMISSARELLDKPAAIPQRVLDELKKAKAVKAAQAETFDDIFVERLGAKSGVEADNNPVSE